MEQLGRLENAGEIGSLVALGILIGIIVFICVKPGVALIIVGILSVLAGLALFVAGGLLGGSLGGTVLVSGLFMIGFGRLIAFVEQLLAEARGLRKELKEESAKTRTIMRGDDRRVAPAAARGSPTTPASGDDKRAPQ